MNMIMSAIWAMELVAFEQMKRLLAAISDGPAKDAQRQGLPLQSGGGVAVVSLSGPMVKNEGWMTDRYGFASTDATKRAIQAAVNDADIQVVVLRIDSPGGSVDGLAELGDAIYAAKQVKPVIAQVSGMCASAAYYAASQATRIYAGRMDLVGSLGTRMAVYDYSELFAKDGVKAIPIDTSPEDRPFKSAGLPGTPITDQQVADFQRVVDDYGNDFRATIQRGRNMAAETVDAVFDGRIWVAADAQKLGLIDGIQTAEETISQLMTEISNQTNERTLSARAKIRAMTLDKI